MHLSKRSNRLMHYRLRCEYTLYIPRRQPRFRGNNYHGLEKTSTLVEYPNAIDIAIVRLSGASSFLFLRLKENENTFCINKE